MKNKEGAQVCIAHSESCELIYSVVTVSFLIMHRVNSILHNLSSKIMFSGKLTSVESMGSLVLSAPSPSRNNTTKYFPVDYKHTVSDMLRKPRKCKRESKISSLKLKLQMVIHGQNLVWTSKNLFFLSFLYTFVYFLHYTSLFVPQSQFPYLWFKLLQ